MGRRAPVVKDDTNDSQPLAGILRMSGHATDSAADGFEAFDLQKENAGPDFMLLDMSMPRCDGPTMIRADSERRKLRVKIR